MVTCLSTVEWKDWRRKAALIGHMPVFCRMERLEKEGCSHRSHACLEWLEKEGFSHGSHVSKGENGKAVERMRAW